MKLAVLKAPFEFEVVDEPTPPIRPDEVLVRVAACGVCASELDAWRGRAAAPGAPPPGGEVRGLVE
jgi:threonine dehydrogenase-like Zn-dependent dehydrogenase